MPAIYQLSLMCLVLALNSQSHAQTYSIVPAGDGSTNAMPDVNQTSQVIETDLYAEYSSENLTIRISPPSSYGIDIGSTASVTLNITVTTQSNITLKAFSLNPDIVDIVGTSEFFLPGTGQNSSYNDSLETGAQIFYRDGSVFVVAELQLEGRFVGYASIEFDIIMHTGEGRPERLPLDVKASAVRVLDAIYYTFQVLIYVAICLVFTMAGCTMQLDVLKETLRRPKAPAVALFCQFTVMPLLAYTITRAMGYTGGTALGFFAMGCVPGGGPSNMYAHLLDGDLTVSIAMTTLSVVVSVAMIPFWLYTLGTTLPPDPNQEAPISIPFVNLLMALGMLIVPLSLGVLIKFKVPRLAKHLPRLLKPVMLVVTLLLLVFGIYANLFIFISFNAKLMLSGAMLPYGGFLLGGLIAWAMRFNWRLIKTIAIETGIQNVSIVIVILLAALPQPDADLSLIPPMAATVMTPIPLFIWAVAHNVRLRCIGAQGSKDLKEEEEDEEIPKDEADLMLAKETEVGVPLEPVEVQDESTDNEWKVKTAGTRKTDEEEDLL